MNRFGDLDLVVPPSEDGVRVVVYSCYFGAYEPFNPDATGDGVGYDRVVLTDQMDLVADGIQFVRLNLKDFPDYDHRRLSRLAKMCPHIFFPDYEWAFYIDNGADLMRPAMAVVGDIEALYQGLPPRGRYLFKHRMRACAYREARVCMKQAKMTGKEYRRQVARYRAEGFPEEYGLYVNTMMIQRMGDPMTDRMNETWLQHYLDVSPRDQVSLPYIMWKLDYPVRTLPFALTDIAQWPKFRSWKRERFRRSVAKRLGVGVEMEAQTVETANETAA